MNALVAFRANAAGTLSVTKAQRQAAQETISANTKASVASQVAATKAASTKSTTSDTTTTSNDELGRDAFLQLLVLEMQNQDPLEPVDNADMIAQLAQFSSLEQMETLNESMGTVADNIDYLSGNVDQLNFITAQGLLGKYVEGVDRDGEALTGTVESVHLSGSIVVLTVDGEIMPMTNVLSVADEAPASDTSDG